MRKIKIILCILCSMLFCFINEESIIVHALEEKYIIETTICIENIVETRVTSNKSASKTLKVKTNSNDVIWQVKVTGNFSYNGSTSICTSSSVSTQFYNKNRKLINQSSSKNKNIASATAKAGLYRNKVLIETLTKSVSISCDKNGNIK